MTKRLLLNQARNAESDKSNMTIPVELNTNRELIVDGDFNETINQYSVYLDEREACTKVRLSASVNIVASNVIFNSVTEIVKDEGSKDCKCINFSPEKVSSTIGKPSNFEWGRDINAAIMDTQLSYSGDENKNYTYLCGIDIFDNHILRSKTSFPVYWRTSYITSLQDKPLDAFNSISDYVRDDFGLKEKKYSAFVNDYHGQYSSKLKFAHRYNMKNIMSFEESLQKNLVNNDGWVGFYNKGQMLSLSGGKPMGIENVLNNETRNKFIDLFPGRDRYSFTPHYNKFRKRFEKNWEYCLTYPCDSTTTGIPFINKNLNTLKISHIDENEASDDEVYKCTIYSVSKHGLFPDDTINLYRSKRTNDSESEIVESNLVVDEVIDDYAFTVYTSEWVCKKWVSVFDKSQLDNYRIKHSGGSIYTIPISSDEKISILSVNNYLNIDFDEDGHIGSQNLSFTKTVDDIECKYYVRIFSRFPNFDFYDGEITEENIYKVDPILGRRVVDEYSNMEYERQSTVSKLGFSRNAYGDNICEVVYNDDIGFDVIKDNLGRPLTSLYITFFKTNYGRKEWYQKNDDEGIKPDITSDKVEWSRCFGKLNCGFEYSPYLDDEKWKIGNIRVMNNVNGIFGLPEDIFTNDGGGENGDEIQYRKQTRFYGDLCMYSPSECKETVIQDCCHRFNTMQRETGGKLSVYGTSSDFMFVYHNEIVADDDDIESAFTVLRTKYDTSGCEHPEGYYYNPNFEVPIRTFSQKLSEFIPKMTDISKINKELGTLNYIITTPVDNYFDMDSHLYVYDTLEQKSYAMEVVNILDLNMVLCSAIDKVDLNVNTPERYKIYHKNVVIPDYAEIIQGYNGAYRWREVVQNGFEDNEGIIEEYPFVNGCLYIHRDINLFLKRQDPFGEYGLSSQSIYFGLPQITGKRNPVEDGTAKNVKDAIKESDIKC